MKPFLTRAPGIGRTPGEAAAQRGSAEVEAPKNGFGYALFVVFVVSWFLHMGTRIPFFGTVRADLLIILLISASIALSGNAGELISRSRTGTALLMLIAWVLVTLPFVEWPGSVLNRGLAELIKALVFYYFTVCLITTERRLRTLMLVFLTCQSFRVIEPLWLNLTTGYWGSFASMANWEYLYRLSGAPSDTVNPNGLAFIICTVFPFLHFLAPLCWTNRFAYLLLAPALLYALILTSSRTGFLGIGIIVLGIFLLSRRKVLIVAVSAVTLIVLLGVMTGDQKDRLRSIFSSDTKNAATAEGRVQGWFDDLKVASRKPVVGHGIATSAEANANYGTEDKPAHNLYLEVAQEIGFGGLAIYLVFLSSIVVNFAQSRRNIGGPQSSNPFLRQIVLALDVWLMMNFLFSFASYGLTSYEWYFFAGLSVCVTDLSAIRAEPSPTPDARGGGVMWKEEHP